ncbi:hypothetical protein BGX34_000361 [Mortierella sp. NVP85]|nr:hypothetical protein BGX34_000361 [Mortierella sp. NVP85]
MPMQSFEFYADSTVSLVSQAAINRKSCDHCFLNRKTCDKVRQAADLGEKCRRCAKDNRPCTFTPTVHLYHIADCVGRHQCRAKVIQAMGGRKKEVQYKTIEIPIVCDMDSPVDQALFDYIQKQPNLLVYNNRIKSFLAQDLLGISADHEDVFPVLSQNYAGYSVSPSSPSDPRRLSANELASFGNSSSSVSGAMTSPLQGPQRYRPSTSAEVPLVQPPPSYRAHPYAQHQRAGSDDRGVGPIPTQRPSYSPRSPVAQNFHRGSVSSNGLSPLSSPNALNPVDGTSGLDQRRRSENFAASTALMGTSPVASAVNLGGMFPQQIQQALQRPFQPQPQPQQAQQAQHPYAQQSPYPQLFQQSQPINIINTTNYRHTSPFPPSPMAPSPLQGSPSTQPPSPLDLSMSLNPNFSGDPSNNSPQGLPSLFDTTLVMQQQQQQFQHQSPFRQREPSASSAQGSISPSSSALNLGLGNDDGAAVTNPNPAPMVITHLNEEGREVGFYYAAPAVNLNPGARDADLCQDFGMAGALGEDYIWVRNLFDEKTTGVDEAALAAATATTATAATSMTSVATPSEATKNTFTTTSTSTSTAIPHPGNQFGLQG